MGSFYRAKEKGSYTVEISLIMPMVFGIILLTIYLAFYVHDCIVMDYALLKICGNYEPDGSDLIDGRYVIDSGELDRAMEKCIAKWDYEIHSDISEYDPITPAGGCYTENSISAGRIKVSIEAKMNSSAKMIIPFTGGLMGYKSSCVINRVNETEWVIEHDIQNR